MNTHLSRRARHALTIDAATAYRSLLPASPVAVEARDVLESLKPADVFAAPPRDANAAAAALAGLWVWHGDLETSHVISQALETAEGSYWHAIIHRREGDFSNAKYWYRRAVNHATAASMTARVDAITRDLPGDKSLLRLTVRGWDPGAFVDLVEAVHAGTDDPRRAAAIAVQRAEWDALFEHCVRAATA